MTTLVGYLVLFTVVAVLFIFVHLMIGKMVRPAKPSADKLTIYECGEPTIGSAWIQFDVRFYVVALLFVIFDVEVAFFFPWAVVFGHANTIAKADPAHDAARLELAQRELARTPPGQPVSAEDREGAWELAQLAFIDIVIFFGVLLVGFAYLWRRGDLDWVRSIAAERVPAPPEMVPEPPVEAGQFVRAGPV
jgi:NADH-quinone oxidoreductase subunit A